MQMTSISSKSALPAKADIRPWTLERITVHLVLIGFVILALGPIAVVIINSLKTTPAIFGAPFALPFGDTFSLAGYGRVFTRGNFLLNYRNSIIVTVSSVGLTVIVSTLAAYALVEYKLRIVPLLAGLFLIGVMLPIRLGTIPIIKIMAALGHYRYAAGAYPCLHRDEHPARRDADDDLFPHRPGRA
jgi:raffinose/stachyose/melibiose transport system permease protein